LTAAGCLWVFQHSHKNLIFAAAPCFFTTARTFLRRLWKFLLNYLCFCNLPVLRRAGRGTDYKIEIIIKRTTAPIPQRSTHKRNDKAARL